MLYKHRNEFIDVIRAAGLDPRRFIPSEDEVDTYKAFTMSVGDSGLYFLVRTRYSGEDREFHCIYTNYKPSHPKPEFTFMTESHWTTLAGAKTTFRKWLDTSAKRFINALEEEESDRAVPDLWSELRSASLTEGSQELENTPFTPEEQTRVVEAMNALKEEVRTRGLLSEEQFRRFQNQLEYQAQASKRLNRKDWLNGFLGSLIGYTLQSSLSTDTAKEIIRLAGEAVQWIADTPLLLL